MGNAGRLVYKCRKCGETYKGTGVPDGSIALAYAITGTSIERLKWGPISYIHMVDVHTCNNNDIGVSDLIGFEADKKEEE